MTKFGKTIIPFECRPEPHELDTARFFNKLGKDVEFLAPVYSKGIKTPDIKMSNTLWEIKSPKGRGKYTFQHSFKEALRQSQNIIFDLRRNSLPEDKSVHKVKKLFDLSKSVKWLLIITQSHKLLDFKK